ncbi:MAG: hypothetical protein E7672_02985 [Ruminococcaceae bacterium]|nr:hypothetical protein [Oscillospiraceae bacterium]
MKKLYKILLVAMIVLMVLPTVVSAANPYATYTYSIKGNVLSSPTAYVPDTIVDSKYIGLEVPLDDIGELFVGPDMKVYISETRNDRVVVLDRYYKLDFEISTFINEQGVPDSFNNPAGVFVDEQYIYVCDTDNNRIVIFDLDGNYKKIIGKPESNLFEEGSVYKPIACAADDYGRLFVVSSTTYQGIIILNLNGDFFGFIGAQKVSVSALELLWRNFQTEAQKAQRQENVSTEFNNIVIDDRNFIYVTTSSIDESQQQAAIRNKDKNFSPVKKLNASGIDVLARNGFFGPGGEVKVDNSSRAEITGASKIIDVALGPEETWSIIDTKRSKVFTYDNTGNLLFAFGDKNGTQFGNIDSIGAITYQGSKILLLDTTNDNFVVFRRTEYGDLLVRALEHDNNRMYDLIINDWTEILKRNNNFDAAYIRIGQSLFRQGEYEEAMKYYKSAFDTENYSKAYTEIRKSWSNKNFWIFPIIIVVAFVALSKFLGFTGKVNKRTALKVGRKSLKEELIYAFHVIVHPFDGFWDLKHEKRGSVKSAFVILLITIIVYFYNSIGQGYIFNPLPSTTFNIMGAIAAVFVPVMLWVISNWCLTTLFDGEGSMADVFVATCYCLTPLPILILPGTIASNFLNLSEGGLITLLSTIAYLWLGILVVLAMQVTHDYSVVKNLLTCVVTIVFMAFIMFVGILFTTLTGKVVSFITNIIDEISYRL